MRLLIDTHVLLWLVLEPDRVSRLAFDLLSQPEHQLLVSAASAYEIGFKHQQGRLPDAARLLASYHLSLAELDVLELPIDSRHALAAARLPLYHRDPFDRLIASQAVVEGIPVVSRDQALSDLGAARIW